LWQTFPRGLKAEGGIQEEKGLTPVEGNMRRFFKGPGRRDPIGDIKEKNGEKEKQKTTQKKSPHPKGT